MIKLNLEPFTPKLNLLKKYLEENVSETLASKINNGVIIEKDGKRLINRKTLKTFMRYAREEAKKQEIKGEQCAIIEDIEVYGWAIHYFEENDIIGTLYNEDGTEYKPSKPEYKPAQSVPTPVVSQKSTKPKSVQPSLFDFLSTPEDPSKNESVEEKIEAPIPKINDDKDSELETSAPEDIDDSDGEPTELEVDKETGEILSIIPFKINKPNSIYERYLDVEKQYPHAVVAYRLGDFYEVFGDNAVLIAKELELTLTGRDCGLEERVPMVGFPYHASDSYFRKIRARHKLVIMEDGETQVLENLSFEQETPKPVPAPPPVLKEPELTPIPKDEDDDDLKELREQTKHIDKDALCLLLELFDYELDIQ